MLDAQADGERLGLDIDAARVQHLEGIARAVADGEDDVAGRDAAAVLADHRTNLAIPAEFEIGDFGPEAVFAAQRLDGGTQMFDHGDEAEGADMGLGDGEDFRRRASAHKLGENLAAEMAGVLDAAVELAVGEGAGAALAELHVGFRVEQTFAPQVPRVFGALADGFAAIEDDRAEPHLGEHQGGEQAAGSGADHHRAWGIGGGAGDEAVGHVRRGKQAMVARETGQGGGLVAQRDVDGVDQRDRRFAPGVPGAAGHLERQQIAHRQCQPGKDRLRQRGRRMVERQLQFGETQHLPAKLHAARLLPGQPCRHHGGGEAGEGGDIAGGG